MFTRDCEAEQARVRFSRTDHVGGEPGAALAGTMAGTQATGIAGAIPGAYAQYPRLLYMNDLPPSNLNGGPILIRRLLADYPLERLTVACGRDLLPRASATLLPCEHVTLFRTNSTGPWGLGRVKQLVDLLALAHVTRAAERLIRAKRVEAVLTVADDLFFLAAVDGASRAGVSCVAVVHDDWIARMRLHTWLPRAFTHGLFRRALRRASRVYAVSEGVQDWLARDFGVVSEVQLPATEPHQDVRTSPRKEPPFRIAFTGTAAASVMAGLDLLVKALAGRFGGDAWRLDLCGVSEEAARRRGWTDQRIYAHGWGTQEQIRAVLRESDMVYPPLGFDPEARVLALRSFSSKLTDYLASGRATLVCAPPEASVSRHVRKYGCAELVDEPSPDRLADAVGLLMKDPGRRQALAERGLAVFREHHDIRAQRIKFVADLLAMIAAAVERR